MWIKKNRLDRPQNGRLPIPTQIISNEEYLPTPQTPEQRKVELLLKEWSAQRSKTLGLSRREFLAGSCGMAMAFMAMNEVFGPWFRVHASETYDLEAYPELWPKTSFVFDVQTHHVRTDGVEPLFFRKLSAPFNKELAGVEPQKGDLQFRNFIKEVFFDSDTQMAVISGVASNLFNVLNSDEMVEGRERINAMAGSQRLLAHGLTAPFFPNFLEETERMALDLKVDSWKFYPGVVERKGEFPFWMDDEELMYPFYEKILGYGMDLVCVHKGLPLPGSSLEHNHPRDIEKAARDHPDINFIIYHSGFKAANYELPPGDGYIQEGGYLPWTTDLVRMREANPDMTNVYMELGTTFGHTVITHPNVCAHFLGQILKAYGVDHVIWGTDAIWWGSPQWQIEAFRRFKMPESLQEEFGYPDLTDADKDKILGLNAARLYGIDPDAARKALPADGLSQLKNWYGHEGGQPSNTQYGWIKA